MHCELSIAGLLPPREAAPLLEGLALPALELLLARARQTSDEAHTLETWIASSFGADETAEIPAGALTVAALGGEPGEAQWLRADPVHLKLNRDQLVLVPADAFGTDLAEAESLVETLNGHFAGELTFYPLQAGRWCVRVGTLGADGLRTRTPAAVAGQDVNRNLPEGGESKRWHGLLNEIQMRLHEHPVNEAREARGEPPINSVWLWGAGRLPAEGNAHWQSVTADEPIACGYARVAGLRHRPLPTDANLWLDRLPEDGRQLAVLDSLRLPFALGDFEAWRARLSDLEAHWFAPLLAALKSGRIGMLTVLVPDGVELRAFEATRNDLRHFWRRARPLSYYL